MEYLKKNKGFTVMELIITLAISSIVFSAISLFFISNYKMFFRADNQIKAQGEVQKGIDYIIDKVIESKGIVEVKDKDGNSIEDTTGAHDISYIKFENGTDDLIFEFSGKNISLEEGASKNTVADNIKFFKIAPIEKDYLNCNGIQIIIKTEIESNNGNYEIEVKDQVFFRNK